MRGLHNLLFFAFETRCFCIDMSGLHFTQNLRQHINSLKLTEVQRSDRHHPLIGNHPRGGSRDGRGDGGGAY